ncbi:hypothetical protein [Streptomyces sp900116325]|uniref:hypothetical protein n=1 Tax=Streptomyces sp. 900116325 TaxID=3154295 RepID=UPI0033D8229E
MPATPAGEDPDAADASLRGTAGELLLALYDRVPVDSPKLDATDASLRGTAGELLLAWDPDE